jgi:hypothetical protein
MTYLSEGFKKLALPQSVTAQIVSALLSQKQHGDPGKFFYVPMDIQKPEGGKVSIIAVQFLQPVTQDNIQAQPGDVSICLQSEWNVDENPIGTYAIRDGHHRMN